MKQLNATIFLIQLIIFCKRAFKLSEYRNNVSIHIFVPFYNYKHNWFSFECIAYVLKTMKAHYYYLKTILVECELGIVHIWCIRLKDTHWNKIDIYIEDVSSQQVSLFHTDSNFAWSLTCWHTICAYENAVDTHRKFLFRKKWARPNVSMCQLT